MNWDLWSSYECGCSFSFSSRLWSNGENLTDLRSRLFFIMMYFVFIMMYFAFEFRLWVFLNYFLSFYFYVVFILILLVFSNVFLDIYGTNFMLLYSIGDFQKKIIERHKHILSFTLKLACPIWYCCCGGSWMFFIFSLLVVQRSFSSLDSSNEKIDFIFIFLSSIL